MYDKVDIRPPQGDDNECDWTTENRWGLDKSSIQHVAAVKQV